MRVLTWLSLWLLVAAWSAVGCEGPTPGGPTAVRHYEFRGIGGFSMGSMTAVTLGLRRHEKFDIVAPLGGVVDMGLFLYIIKDELMAGFCQTPGQGEMCPAEGATQTYESMNVGPKSQGGFDRENMIEAFQDMAIAMGNPIMFNPHHPYLPPGVPPSYLELSKAERCSQPVRLKGFYDKDFNPDGEYTTITFCESKGILPGVFNPDAEPRKPVEITLAIDWNDNGRRDSGEPVLFQATERYDDFGEDGLFNEDEEGFDESTNPDPAGDDWDPTESPFGTEGNHLWDEGEPYLDYGLDGVAGTADSPFDWGEGIGRFDMNMNLLRSAVMYDPARLLKDLTDDQLARLDFYLDVGIRDHMRFLDTYESFAGILAARGRGMDVRDGFKSLLVEGFEGAFHINQIDWDGAGRDVYVRYGDWDATPEMIARGDGGHVGDYAQVLWRFFTIAAYVSERWPGGDYEDLTGPEFAGEEWDDRLVDTTFYSEILGQDRQYYLLLPPGYDQRPELRYPALYMVHGLGMSATEMTASALFTPQWMREGLLQKYIMVFPDGLCQDECFSGTFFYNQLGRNKPPRRYEDSFFEELIPHIDATYRTRLPEDIEVPLEYMAPLGQ